MWVVCALCGASLTAYVAPAFGFEVDTCEQPAGHPPLSPVEMCQRQACDRGVIRVDGIDMPFYNHSEALTEGTWFWRYFVVTAEGEWMIWGLGMLGSRM